jgi:hypothetical protein
MVSGNTFGGIFWSDGFSLSPMMPDIPLFTRCSVCGYIFCLTRCGQYESEGEEAYSLPDVAHLNIDGLKEAIEKNVYAGQREEIHLRIRLWWALNKRSFGQHEKVNHITDDLYRENAKKLINLLNEDDEDELLTTAELHRNLGEFKKCREIISKITNRRNENRANQIMEACKAGISSVIRIE